MNSFIAKFSGRSMQPTLKDGMLLVVEKIGPQEAKPADIILYQNGNSLVTHRLIRIFQQGERRILVTKGDNHAYIDAGLVPQEALLGRIQAAFYEHEPQKNILIKNKAVGGLYIAMADLAFLMRKHRESVPAFIRTPFKPLVGIFFTAFKKTIHFICLLF